PEYSTLSLHDALPISFDELIRAVRDEIAGTDERVAVRLDARRMHGVARGMRQEAEKVRRRMVEPDLERVIVDRGDAEAIGRHLRSEEHTSELQSRENL